MRNSTGAFVKADLAGTTAAAAGAAENIPGDFRVSITNAPGKNSYPICSFTWLLIPSSVPDAAKRTTLKEFIKWMATEGQEYAEPLGYARIPHEVAEKEIQAISLIN